MLRLLLHPLKLFSRKKQPQLDPDIIQSIQFQNIKKYQKKNYKQPNSFKHQDILYQQQLYGHKCQISGITQNNLKSSEFTNQVIGSGKPNLVILGGLNDTQAMVDFDQPISNFLNIQNLMAKKLYCKSTLLPVIQKNIEQNLNFYYDQKKKIIWKTDHFNKTLQVNDYYNAAYQSMFLDYKIIYGKPSSIIIYEDIILRVNLQQLKTIYQLIINKVMQNNVNICQSSSSVILQQIKTYAMYEQPLLYSKQITYTTALLNKLTKIQNNNLLLIPKCFVKRISQQVHHLNIEPQTIYRNWINDQQSQNYQQLSKIIYDQKITQILEKFVILSILKGFHLEVYLHHGKNFFKHSIFKDLFNQMTAEEILANYKPIKSKYMEKIFNIMKKRIKNKITHHPPQAQYMHLIDQFQTIQKRKQLFQYQFQPKNYVTQKQDTYKLIKLKQKIQEISKLQCDQYQLQILEEYQKGNITKQGIILYSKLVGKANIQLKQKVKLPYYHFNAFRGFYKQYYKDYILFDQDKKKRNLQIKKFNKISQKINAISRQITDPEELRSLLSGQKGKVKQLNMYQDQSTGEIDADGEIDQLYEVLKQMGASDDMMKDVEQFRKTHPRDVNKQLDIEDQDFEGGQEDEGQGQDFGINQDQDGEIQNKKYSNYKQSNKQLNDKVRNRNKRH